MLYNNTAGCKRLRTENNAVASWIYFTFKSARCRLFSVFLHLLQPFSMAAPSWIKYVPIVDHGNDGPPWYPAIKETDGATFFELTLKDHGLQRFLWGETGYVRCTAADEFKNARNDEIEKLAIPGKAAALARRAAAAALADDGVVSKVTPYKQRMTKSHESKCVKAFLEENSTVVVTVRDTQVRMMCPAALRDNVCIELTNEMLSFVKDVCTQTRLTDVALRKAEVPPPAKGVYWHKGCAAFYVPTNTADEDGVADDQGEHLPVEDENMEEDDENTGHKRRKSRHFNADDSRGVTGAAEAALAFKQNTSPSKV